MAEHTPTTETARTLLVIPTAEGRRIAPSDVSDEQYEAVRERVREVIRLSKIADSAWVSKRTFDEFDDLVEEVADAVLAAVGPLIERAVGERIAREIEDFEPEDRALVHMPDWREAMYDAARIARGEGQ